MKIGLTLPNRGILFGAITVPELLDLAAIADRAEGFHSVWVGDSLFGKPRLDSITLLAALAARTRRVRLGTACMASFTLRDPVQLAYQWASLDQLTGGRTVLVGCTGITPQAGYAVENRLYGVDTRGRVERLGEWITLLKRLWTEDEVTHTGKHYRCEGVTIAPKPAAQPCPPIWIASDAEGERAQVERSHRRIARYADGWQTAQSDPAELAWRLPDVRAKVAEAGRDPASLATHLYQNINVGADRATALAETTRFLETYYARPFARERMESWTAAGTPEECVAHLRVYERLGFDEITLRITSWDQGAQLRRVIDSVLPHFA